MTLTSTDPLAPLVAFLDRLNREWTRLGVAADLRPDPAVRWEPMCDFAEPPYAGLRAMVEQTAAMSRAPDHVAAALLWKTYAYWTALPVVLGWALNRRVPLVTLASTVVCRSETPHTSPSHCQMPGSRCCPVTPAPAPTCRVRSCCRTGRRWARR